MCLEVDELLFTADIILYGSWKVSRKNPILEINNYVRKVRAAQCMRLAFMSGPIADQWTQYKENARTTTLKTLKRVCREAS